MPRPRKQTRPARQYARPGCCYELPITIDEDDHVAPSNKIPKPMPNHTAAWMQALASGRFGGEANKPPVEAVQAQGARKRALPNVDYDNEEPRDGGAKRLRLSGCDSNATRTTSQTINGLSYRTTPYNLSKTAEEQHEATPAAPEFALRTRQRQINPENVIVRDIQMAEEQTRLTGRARAAELLRQQNHPAYPSDLRTMWQDHDRQRKVAEERLRNEERERREEAQRQAQEAEEKRLGIIAGIEANIRSMWDADPLDVRGDPKIKPGQLSAAGQQRVREREERLRRSRF